MSTDDPHTGPGASPGPGLKNEADFLAELNDCHEVARQALGDQDWNTLSGVSMRLDRLSGDLSRAMAAGFASEPVEHRLKELITFFRKALLQASAADQSLRQKESDLLQQRQNIVTEASNSR